MKTNFPQNCEPSVDLLEVFPRKYDNFRVEKGEEVMYVGGKCVAEIDEDVEGPCGVFLSETVEKAVNSEESSKDHEFFPQVDFLEATSEVFPFEVAQKSYQIVYFPSRQEIVQINQEHCCKTDVSAAVNLHEDHYIPAAYVYLSRTI